MEFSEAWKVLKQRIETYSNQKYDGVIVKKLEATNTLDKGRSSKQTHIAVTGEQMDIFPYISANGYFSPIYDNRDEQLKKYFVAQIPVRIFKKNVQEIIDDESAQVIDFGDKEEIITNVSVVRSRRNDQADQMQMSLINLDDSDFISFRRIVHTGATLVLLKHYEKIMYDCIVFNSTDEFSKQISSMNNKFYRDNTQTKFETKKWIVIEDEDANEVEYSVEELAAILKDMYTNAEERMQVASIYIFGIKYGKTILEKGYTAKDIISGAGMNDSFKSELLKALNTYRCLKADTYGVSILHDKIDTDEGTPYTKENFLNEVYMKEEEYDFLRNLLLSRKNVILQGAPGVGKTFMAKRLAYSILGYKSAEKVQMVQFHQSYSYEDFVVGYRPNATGFEIAHGPFYDFCKAAQKVDGPCFFIIDEINRGNVSKIFGELLMLIEADKRGDSLKLLYTHEDFSVPDNVYIIGMMNTADRSLAIIDYALRRRFAFYDVKPAFANPLFIEKMNNKKSDELNRLLGYVKNLNTEIANDDALGEGFEIGHSYFCTGDDTTVDKTWLRSVVEYSLIPLLNEYWFDDKEKAKKWANDLREVEQ